MAPPTAAPATPTDAKQARANIEALEASLKTLPVGPAFEPTRQSLLASIEQEKASIRGLKPPGARLDEARAALTRAHARKEEATKAVELANAALLAADQEISTYQANVDELERAISDHGNMDMQSSADAAPATPAAALDAIAAQLGSLLDSLKSNAHVNPAHTEAADSHVTFLLQGLSDTIKIAECAAAPMRLNGKQLPPASAGTATVVERRLNGKQPVKKQSTLFQHGVVRKALKPKN